RRGNERCIARPRRERDVRHRRHRGHSPAAPEGGAAHSSERREAGRAGARAHRYADRGRLLPARRHSAVRSAAAHRGGRMKQAARLAFAAACIFAAAAAIADPPSAFTLTATPVCSAGHPAILLQWTTSGGAASYDVTRDSVTLVQGLSSDTTSFEDSSSDVGSTHAYIITAINEEGSTKSNTVSASAPPSVCTPPPPPPVLTGSAS